MSQRLRNGLDYSTIYRNVLTARSAGTHRRRVCFGRCSIKCCRGNITYIQSACVCVHVGGGSENRTRRNKSKTILFLNTEKNPTNFKFNHSSQKYSLCYDFLVHSFSFCLFFYFTPCQYCMGFIMWLRRILQSKCSLLN